MSSVIRLCRTTFKKMITETQTTLELEARLVDWSLLIANSITTFVEKIPKKIKKKQ